MGLVEMLIVMTMLALISVGTAYYFTQSQTVMRSSAQDSDCQSIAQSGLDRVVSLGTRLYGYRVGHTDPDLRYNPLFIKKGTQITGSTPAAYRITDTSSGNNLSLTDKYKNLYEELTNNTPPALLVNTGVPLVNLSGSGFINIGTSVLLVNSVNFLQYMYNSDPEFFNGNSGKGKDFTITSSTSTSNNKVIASLWKDYLKKYNLQNVKFYIRINPVDLKNQKVIESYSGIKCYYTRYKGSKFVSTEIPCPRPSSHPSHKLVLTHPRLSVGTSTLSSSSNLRTIGNPDLGFQVTVKLSYEKNNQDYFCKSMQRFAHQTRLLMEQTTPINVSVTSLKNDYNKNLLPNGGRKQTSCDTDDINGTDGHRNITMELNFDNTAGRTTKEFGTLFLCRGIRWKYPKRGCNNTASSEKIYGPWRRCHEVKFPDQRGHTESVLLNSSGHDIKLRLKFNNLKEDRSYALEIAEVSQLGISKPPYQRITNSRFYIDATRPTLIASINDIDVGPPEDMRRGRSYLYNGHTTNWDLPEVRFKYNSNYKKGPGLQCNDDAVDFHGCIIDEFHHNLGDCTATHQREDGNGLSSITSVTMTTDTSQHACSGTLSSPIPHGQQTVKITASDICGSDPESSDQLKWDTDLPNTFVARPFPTSPHWLYRNASNARPKYTIQTLVPASGAGTFPKHYAVTCYGKQYGYHPRKDGNGGSIACEFYGSLNSSHLDHDGCNPADFGVKYHHICGRNSAVQAKKWGVWVAEPSKGGGLCDKVPCEPGLICCDGFGGDGECGRVTTHRCDRNDHDHKEKCNNPTGGGNSEQDTTSDCPPLGLYDCNYNLPCRGKSQDKEILTETDDGSACKNKRPRLRRGNECTFTEGGRCHNNHYTDKNVIDNRDTVKANGTCRINGRDSEESCNNIDVICRTKYKLANGSGHETCKGEDTNAETTCEDGDEEAQNGQNNCEDSNAKQGNCTPPPGSHPPINAFERPSSVNGTCDNNSGSQEGARCKLKYESKGEVTTECKAKSGNCSVPFKGTCQEPQGDCDPKGRGGSSGAQCTARPPTPSSSPGATPPSTPDAPGFGACASGTCTHPFCAENCASPGRCHVKDIGGVCHPSCGHAARLKFGRDGYGPDRKPNTSDDLHFYRQRPATTCNDLSITYSDGVTVNNWVVLSSIQGRIPYEVLERGGSNGVCCIRGSASSPTPTPTPTPASTPAPVPTPSVCEFGSFAICNNGKPSGTRCDQIGDGCYDRICKDGYIEQTNGTCIQSTPTCSGNQYVTKDTCENALPLPGKDFCVKNNSSGCWVQGPPVHGQCGSDCGTCRSGVRGRGTLSCNLHLPDIPEYQCSWACDGQNGGLGYPDCRASDLSSPCG